MAARIIITKQGDKYQITYKSGSGMDMKTNKLTMAPTVLIEALKPFFEI